MFKSFCKRRHRAGRSVLHLFSSSAHPHFSIGPRRLQFSTSACEQFYAVRFSRISTSACALFYTHSRAQFSGSARQCSREELYDEILASEQEGLKEEVELMANRYFHIAATGHQVKVINNSHVSLISMKLLFNFTFESTIMQFWAGGRGWHLGGWQTRQ
jgi:hypothetical protein